MSETKNKVVQGTWDKAKEAYRAGNREWLPTTEDYYCEMRDCLPPAYVGPWWGVGEPWSHNSKGEEVLLIFRAKPRYCCRLATIAEILEETKLPVYVCKFNGREVGAIGIMSDFTVEVQAASPEDAKLRTYLTHEHHTRFTAVLKEQPSAPAKRGKFRQEAKERMHRAALVEAVASCLTAAALNDLPMIRTAINDTADSYRKDGFTVPDFAQDRMVASVKKAIRNR